ncbi:hypothetical protein [Lactococcus kimchii]|uniref:hypothetical protein n=1 Tax=Lactococcus sp. S-13 TaxID=2507158 RepID=UPI0010236B27|nr:hypothetical protein [Lactococcus sp. S-13]RZI49179.1 hypothetical protein EQJ87_06850 [Lactococcus sp. S-13]
MKVKLWQLILAFVVWVGLMFLPATVNQDKVARTFDFSKSRANYFYFLGTQEQVTSVILVLLFIIIIIGILRKWQSTKYFSLSFMVVYGYGMFLNVVLSRIPEGVPLKFALSLEMFEGLWRIFGLGFFLTSLVGIVFAILLFVYVLKFKKDMV